MRHASVFAIAFMITLALTLPITFVANRVYHRDLLQHQREDTLKVMERQARRVSNNVSTIVSIMDAQTAFVNGYNPPILPPPPAYFRGESQFTNHSLLWKMDFNHWLSGTFEVFKHQSPKNSTAGILLPHDYISQAFPNYEDNDKFLGTYIGHTFVRKNPADIVSIGVRVEIDGFPLDMLVFATSVFLKDSTRWGSVAGVGFVFDFTENLSHDPEYLYELYAPDFPVTLVNEKVTVESNNTIIGSSYTQSYYMVPGPSRFEEATGVAPMETIVEMKSFEPWVLRLAPRKGWVDEFRPGSIAICIVCPLVLSAIVGLAALGFKILQDRRAAEHDRARQLAQLEFLGWMYHELRNPSQAQHVMLEMAPPEIRQWSDFQNVCACAALNRRLLDNALDLMKLEAGKMELAEGPMHVRTVVEEVVGMSRIRLKHKAVIETHIDDSVPAVVRADAMRYQQIVLNLVSNAVKFCKTNVTVGVRYDAEAMILETWVTNDGKELTEEECGRLFQSYTQLTSRIARKYGGTGLGLSVSKGLVELMGGTIAASGANGETTFRFSFPTQEPSGDDIDPNSPRHEKGLPPEVIKAKCAAARVLYVDDNELNRSVGERAAGEAGVHEVEVAEDGKEALEMFKTRLREGKPYHAVFMDLTMPVMDGWDATQAIRKFERETIGHDQAYIVAVSGSCMHEDMERAYVAGVDDFVAKPCSISRFTECVISAMSNNEDEADGENEDDVTNMMVQSLSDEPLPNPLEGVAPPNELVEDNIPPRDAEND